jgi:hypothetical protein
VANASSVKIKGMAEVVEIFLRAGAGKLKKFSTVF